MSSKPPFKATFVVSNERTRDVRARNAIMGAYSLGGAVDVLVVGRRPSGFPSSFSRVRFVPIAVEEHFADRVARARKRQVAGGRRAARRLYRWQLRLLGRVRHVEWPASGEAVRDGDDALRHHLSYERSLKRARRVIAQKKRVTPAPQAGTVDARPIGQAAPRSKGLPRRLLSAVQRPIHSWQRRRDPAELLNIELALARALDASEPDLIYVFDSRFMRPAVNASTRRRARDLACAVIYDAPNPPDTSSRVGRRLAFLEQRLLKSTTHITAPARYAAQLGAQTGADVVPVDSVPLPLGPLDAQPGLHSKVGADSDAIILVAPWTRELATHRTQIEKVLQALLPERPHLVVVSTSEAARAASRFVDRLATPDGVEAHTVTLDDPDLADALVGTASAGVSVGASDEAASRSASTILSAPIVWVDLRAPARELGDEYISAPARRPVEAIVQDLRARLESPVQDASARRDQWRDAMASTAKVVAEAVGEPERAKSGTPLVGFGPRNGNGQGWAWANALRARCPALRTEVFATEVRATTVLRMHFPCDVQIGARAWRSPDWQLLWARHVALDFTHLVLEQGMTACGRLFGRSFYDELAWLHDHGVQVALAFRGSEIRNPARHAEREPWSPFRDPNDELTRRLQEFVAQTEANLSRHAGPVFVTTLDLLDDVPNATWLPQVLDLDLWAPGEEILTDGTPRVMHAPSRERLKGSEYVDRACERLEDEGLIEYVRLRDVPYEEMPAKLREADVVIDQLALGSYGVLALQGMACGRLVLGHVADRVRERVPMELPIVEVTPDDLEERLREVIANGPSYRETARLGRAYVERFHDGRVSAERLAQFVSPSSAEPRSSGAEATGVS